jgi:methylated-DNA-protein-cysteine methyltransferase-like protein
MKKRKQVEQVASVERQHKKKSFHDKALELVRRVPFGKVTTYGAIAEALGAKLSARMVGYALHSAVNTDVPAHRVVNRFGALTGAIHFGHPDRMRQLLQAEGVSFLADGTVDMEKHFYAFRKAPQTAKRRKPLT